MSELPDAWTEEQREMFSKMLRFILANQDGFRHPFADEMAPAHWLTICHNAAWCAAEFMGCDELTILNFETGAVIARTPTLSS